MVNVDCTRQTGGRRVYSWALEDILAEKMNQARMKRILSQAKLDLESEPPDLEVEVKVNFDILQLCENVQAI